MSLVCDEIDPGRPQTHALLVGIGAYPHLLGGSGAPARNSFGLKQLLSPPISARAFADWLLTRFNNPKSPLGSLELLVSEELDESYYTSPRPCSGSSTRKKLDVPTKANLKTAIRRWYDRCHTRDDNMALFYFCGHGLSRLGEEGLLSSDFGSPEATMMENAIDFVAIELAMEQCRARRQCFFIDACRNEPPMLDKGLRDMGDKHVLDGDGTVLFSQYRQRGVYYSTARNEKAHALRDDVSRFTKSLLCGLNGAASHDADGVTWVVNTARLLEATDVSLNLGNRRRDTPYQEARAGSEMAIFDLHTLTAAPVVPVAVCCRPDTASATGELVVTPPGLAPRILPPDDQGWQFEAEVTPGDYLFEVRPVGGHVVAGYRPIPVRPTHRDLCIEVPA